MIHTKPTRLDEIKLCSPLFLKFTRVFRFSDMAAKQLIGSILQLMLLLSTLLFAFTKVLLAIIQVKVTYILLSFRHLLAECVNVS